GEMADADYGYIGCGGGRVNLYRKGQLVEQGIPEADALDALERLIENK
ncbi:MAG: flavodoxin-dependent (E)-4-hydroxy-3-methylbut-2-enyl-diphosphate synthase, partial [Bacteroidales bacterium]|nr:flavodoxin-dependent (E)-4-hydroxy-3-methylbut-2-enyl-diphosphate synthase [Bacteroidales bacterium]